MVRRRISTTGNSAALVLSQDLLGFMGVKVGDEVDLQLIDRSLLVRPVQEVERTARVQGAMDRVFREHSGLLTRLAGGAGEASGARKPRARNAKKKKR